MCAASVYPEPGSNSQIFILNLSIYNFNLIVFSSLNSFSNSHFLYVLHTLGFLELSQRILYYCLLFNVLFLSIYKLRITLSIFIKNAVMYSCTLLCLFYFDFLVLLVSKLKYLCLFFSCSVLFRTSFIIPPTLYFVNDFFQFFKKIFKTFFILFFVLNYGLF